MNTLPAPSSRILRPEPKYETAVEALRVFAGLLRDDCRLPLNKALRGLRYAYKLPLKPKEKK